MRTENSLKNIIGSFGNNLLLNLLRFVSRIIFVRVLGELYTGVNGLLSNVLGLLALSELGIGTAINYSLYKPLEKKDNDKIRALMHFYKNAYRVIAFIVLGAGLIILPFLPYLIKDTTGINHLQLIYLVFLTNMFLGYLFSYKRTLIIADQKNYKIMPRIMLSNLLLTIFQIIVLLLFRNFIIYLLVQTAFVLFENVIVNSFINKQYPILSQITKKDVLNKNEYKTIFGKIRALMLHKIGAYVFTSTDNLVISKFVGIAAVGFYSNYVLIVNMINSFISTLTTNITASLGNLIASDNEKQKYQVFEEMNLICFVLYGFSAIFFIILFQPFIELCFGAKYVLPMYIVLLISFNNYIYGMSSVSITFQNASGLYEKDRYVPLIQAIVNLIISIVLAIKIGIAGVLIGTLISNVLPLVIKPKIIFDNVFKRSLFVYFIDFFKKGIFLLVVLMVVYTITSYVSIGSLFTEIIIRLIVCGFVCLLSFIIVYRKNPVFNKIIDRVKNTIQNIKSRKA